MRFVLPTLIFGILVSGSARAGDDGLTGHWKCSIYEGSQAIPLWLLHLESKDGKLTVSADALKGRPKVKLEDIKLGGDTFSMKMRASISRGGVPQVVEFEYEGKLPKPGAKKILGSLKIGGESQPALLEATTAKNPFELDREILQRTPTDPRGLTVIVDVIEGAKENKVAVKDLQDWVDASLKTAELYGPRLQLSHQLRLLEALQGQDAYPTVGVETARKISKQIDPKMPLDTMLSTLSSVASVLRKGKEIQEATAIDARVAKLEGQAYAEYAKTALNYEIEKYPGRKVKSNRAVLLELFTGAQCPPCVAADMAFDGVEKTYGPGEVVLLQYHMDIPRPEPMSNADSNARFEYYAIHYKQDVGGTPASLFNGKPDAPGGGARGNAGNKYKEYRETINKLLESPDSVTLTATASRQGNKIDIVGKVQGLAKPSDKVRLRFVLVEDWVRFKGGNGLQYHHRVVRALPGGPKGFGLKEKDSEHKASVDLDELRKSLNKYLDEDYPEGPRPLRLSHLNVVAFVQSDESTEVLQAVNVPVSKE